MLKLIIDLIRRSFINEFTTNPTYEQIIFCDRSISIPKFYIKKTILYHQLGVVNLKCKEMADAIIWMWQAATLWQTVKKVMGITRTSRLKCLLGMSSRLSIKYTGWNRKICSQVVQKTTSIQIKTISVTTDTLAPVVSLKRDAWSHNACWWNDTSVSRSHTHPFRA